ncbi:uncharacterized protein LOC128346792 [Hemicordylus capensis]|uniref:uncharacterized protein LOC128346792 n=1 Tax=Hemicordylus capensis TaxID=884348 RepID=UPI0023036F2C|nr:uncharacterized protein LOC128346792 [Hemicordylus capensis]XP_053156452.1 uncharacterized protein LOC128346792 [Hemicordylus capensis]XP_053156453.1 uncharacterized protein LOC128346792 [Hemicordylus capensis]XP_053156454.1 uncharacterized protein LOC128346792 [Hemicordylus capensis]XP_053156455.1 uncharacterized protein LOC128346792 [Hemicordylus capensis]XP_053156456.1 uncharacterized protein LOC128346792 [Hemicordylus capensis]XP_053156457.1 uncharacterized protein LOC128346792 [Hemico
MTKPDTTRKISTMGHISFTAFILDEKRLCYRKEKRWKEISMPNHFTIFFTLSKDFGGSLKNIIHHHQCFFPQPVSPPLVSSALLSKAHPLISLKEVIIVRQSQPSVEWVGTSVHNHKNRRTALLDQVQGLSRPASCFSQWPTRFLWDTYRQEMKTIYPGKPDWRFFFTGRLQRHMMQKHRKATSNQTEEVKQLEWTAKTLSS